MTPQRVADMTLEELKATIAQVVDERMRQGVKSERPKKKRSLQEIMDSIDRNMWTPPPGAPSTLELLREDRDR